MSATSRRLLVEPSSEGLLAHALREQFFLDIEHLAEVVWRSFLRPGGPGWLGLDRTDGVL